MAEPLQNKAIRIALIGKTGVGKSAVGNTLLGRISFKSVTGSASVTFDCNMETAELSSGQIIQVVDTPGIMDTAKREVVHEVTKSIAYLSPGPHAFLLVLQPNRATPEEMNSLKELQNLFGDDSYLQHTIIIMVRRNEIENEDGSLMEIHQFILTRTCAEVQDLYNKCGERIIAVDNKGSDQEMKEKFRNDLVDMIMKFKGYYSHNYFKMVLKNKALHEAIEEQKEKQAKTCKEMAELKATYNLGQQQMDEQKKLLQQEKEARDKEKEEFNRKLDVTIQTFEKHLQEQNKKKCVIS